jgi:hypothetical protein
VPHDRVRELYSVCDLVAYPRKPLPICEMISPIKPLEPMALGIPVLASDVAALREMIVDGVNGWCFPKGDRRALAERIGDFIEGRIDTRAVRQGSRRWVEKNRDWRHLARPAAELYHQLYLDAGGKTAARLRRRELRKAAEAGREAGLAAFRAGLDPEFARRAELVDLCTAPAAPDVEAVVAEFHRRHPTHRLYGDEPIEIARLGHCLGRLPPGRRLLDVGPAMGILLNAVTRAGLYRELTASDINLHPRFINLGEDIACRDMPVTALDFPDGHFDTVTCLQVLEHLAEEQLPQALAELRRVCRGTLLVSVPFREAVPLDRFHRIRFDEARLMTLFPRAEQAILVKRDLLKWHWWLGVERPAAAA